MSSPEPVLCDHCKQEIEQAQTAFWGKKPPKKKQPRSTQDRWLLWGSRIALVMMFFIAEVMGMYWWASHNTPQIDASVEDLNIMVPAATLERADAAPSAAPSGYNGTVTGGTYTLAIQKLGLRAPVVPVGKTASGNMDTTPSLYQVAWYKLGARPGEKGNVVLAAHYGAPDQEGVFRSIDQLNPGDQLTIVVKDNPNLTYQVVRKEYYPVDNAPLNAIFGPNNKAVLNLITCAGDWDAGSRSYNKRLVVYTELVK